MVRGPSNRQPRSALLIRCGGFGDNNDMFPPKCTALQAFCLMESGDISGGLGLRGVDRVL